MVRVGAKLLLLVVLVSWFAPAAVASYAPPAQSCCHRGGHHCNSGSEPAFRSTKVHCQSCQAVRTAQQAPSAAATPVGVSARDEHPFVHEFSSAFILQESQSQRAQRAPPANSR